MQFSRHCQMVACQQPHRQFRGREEAHLVPTGVVGTLPLVVVEEEEDTTIGGHLMTEGLVGGFRQASGGGVKHHRSENLSMVVEEEAEVVRAGQTATGMEEEEADGEES